MLISILLIVFQFLSISFGKHLILESLRAKVSTCGISEHFTIGHSYNDLDKKLSIKMDELPQPSCDRTVRDVGRIVRGTITKWTADFPWLAELRYLDGRAWKHFCGGAILTEYLVLTAAHCVEVFTEDQLIRQLRVRIGEHDLQTDTDTEEDFEVTKIIVHPHYEETITYVDNDVALMKIKPKNGRGILFNDDALPVCLPNTGLELPDWLTAKVAGWGYTKEAKVSRYLRMVEIPILSEDQCKKAHPDDIRAGMMCAGDLSGRRDSCKGDSGGPLVAVLNGRATVIGLVSWGQECGHPEYPGVYTKVSHYVQWILENMPKAC